MRDKFQSSCYERTKARRLRRAIMITYTLESVVAGVLKVRDIHVVDFCHVFLPLLELFLVG